MRKLVALSLLPVCSLAMAIDAPVEDLGGGASVSPVRNSAAANTPRTAPAAAPQNQALTDLHFEVQSLRDEVRELRGIVEEQANALRELRQRQLDDYQDLDRRISAVGAGETPTSSASVMRSAGRQQPSAGGPQIGDGGEGFGVGSAPPASTGSQAAGSSAPSEGEYEEYYSIYNSIKPRVQAGKTDAVVADFKRFAAKFPNGQYTANAYYWLGEIYVLQNNLDDAETAFSTAVDRFPAHSKANDAKFKLAKVYHLQGRDEDAKSLLREVAATNSGAASLARAYLNDNF